MADQLEFDCHTTRQWVHARCTLRGELDLMTVARLREHVRPHVEGPTTAAVTFDLVDLRFIDSSGLQALVDFRRDLVARGAVMTVVRPQRTVRMVLRMMGLEDVLEPVGEGDGAADGSA